MEEGGAPASVRPGWVDRLRSLPMSVFARLVWPVGRALLPERLVKTIGPYRLSLRGRSLSHFLRYVDLWEPRYRRRMMECVATGANVLELGSAYGYYTLLLANRVGPGGAVIGVEPFPRYFEGLVELKERNGIPNLRLLNVGIGDSSAGCFEFGVEDANPYAGIAAVNALQPGSVIGGSPGAPVASESVKVATVTLPALLEREGFEPDYIVMDIEGGEVSVIEQLVSMNLRPELLFEAHAGLIGESRMSHCLDLLAQMGYLIEKIDADHFRAAHP